MSLNFNILSVFLLFSVSSLFAQSNSEWNPIGLAVNGKNMQNGVEAFYKLNKCNNEDVIFIKFINYNSSAVTVEWNDAIFTNELQWTSSIKGNNKKSLIIGSNEAILGDCTETCKPELVIKAHDFIKSMDEFKLFRALSFHVTILNK